MGNQKSSQNKEFDVEINHPNFSKSKIVTEGEYKRLRTNIAIDEKEYDKWKLSSSKYVSPPSNLLLPLDSSFKRTAMCGHTGNATVILLSFSSTTQTFPTCSQKKSITGEAKNLALLKSNSGTCSGASLKPETRQNRQDSTSVI